MSLEQTGADNYEAKVPRRFMPMRGGGGRQTRRLPPDFYSSRHYVDKMIQFIDEGRASGKPSCRSSLQAVHSPHQAPKADVGNYVKRYEAGWTKIRAER
jgi:hypothetical protein